MVNGKKIANWLGDKDECGKSYLEPINVVIEIPTNDPQLAEKELIKKLAAAGFTSQKGHSSGYTGYINGQPRAEFPSTNLYAFSDGPLSEIPAASTLGLDSAIPGATLDHGRFFGPVIWKGHAYFTASFSREKVGYQSPPDTKLPDPTALLHDLHDRDPKKLAQDALGYATQYVTNNVLHPYVSFKDARDHFVSQMLNCGGAKQNARIQGATLPPEVSLDNCVDDPGYTTGDADGKAEVLELPSMTAAEICTPDSLDQSFRNTACQVIPPIIKQIHPSP
jgi:hypothetical protein